MAKLLRLDVAQLTDVGRKREHNEDNMAYVIPKDPLVMTRKGALFLVADGMGGHAAGEVASEIAVDTVSNVYYQDDGEDVETSLLHAIRRANASIYQRAAENMLRSGMGTTCVAAVLRGSTAYIANVGDSRAYFIHRGQVRQVSQDHSWVAEQVRAGLLTEDQARTHAQRNVITRCLGTQPEVEIDIFHEQLEEGDFLVLCTDGLSGLISDEELQRIVDQFVPQESVYHLVERANENGGPDNITAIVVRVQELGTEPVGVRYPARVGGREISEENTMPIIPGAPLGLPARNGSELLTSGPLRFASGPLVSPESDTAPQPALNKRSKKNRLFYPALLLLLLFILTAGGGGFYYFIRANESQLVSQSLDGSAHALIQASNDVTNNPVKALQELSRIQKDLRELQKNHQFDANQRTRLTDLQNELVVQTRTAISNYNRTQKIMLLPCANTSSSSINDGTTNTHAQSIIATSDGTPASPLLLYSLGQDGKIYQLQQNGSQYSLLSSFAAPAGIQITNLAGNGKSLFALSAQLNGGRLSGYRLGLLQPQKGGTLQAFSATPLNIPENGQVPTLLTAWGQNIYAVVSSKANPNSANILSFTADATGHFTAAKPTLVSVSASITSIAAFQQQLFLLLSDGELLSLQITNGALTSLPSSVFLQTPVMPPLATSAENFSASVDVPTVMPQEQKSSVPLMVPATSNNNSPTLSTSIVAGNPHLFLSDPANHRLLDLTLTTPLATSSGPATPTATSTSVTKSITLDVFQQYASSTYFTTIKGVTVDAKGTAVYALTQTNPATLSLVSVSTGQQTGCAS